MAVNSRQSLIDYCYRRLGEPVLEVNVDRDQVEDKVDDALQLYQEYHSDATLRTYFKHQITATDIANKYIPISSDIIYLNRMFRLSNTLGGGSFFNVKYQFYLQNMGELSSFYGDLAYLYQLEQYMDLIDHQLNGTPQVTFSRHQNRLYVFGDFEDEDIAEGDYVIAEVYQIIDPQTHTSVYNDKWLKAYTTALIKEQWGLNMMKFDGMLLPGGVTVNGRQLFDDAQTELEALRESIRLEYENPIDFFVG